MKAQGLLKARVGQTLPISSCSEKHETIETGSEKRCAMPFLNIPAEMAAFLTWYQYYNAANVADLAIEKGKTHP
ncbi:MAG: hypothetical protein NVS4B12_08890 [Ktedonobacteraceae bacterium]